MFQIRVKNIRISLGLSQAEFAEMLKLGSSATVSAWEKGISVPPADKLVEIARLGGVTTDWLLTGEGDPPSAYGTGQSPVVSEPSIKYHPRYIPLIDTLAPVVKGNIIPGNIVGQIPLPYRVNADYAMVAITDSLYNPDLSYSIAPDDTIFCSLSAPPITGDIVVVLTIENRTILRQLYNKHDDGTIELRSFKGNYTPIILNPDKYLLINRVVYAQPPGKSLG